MNYYNYFTEIEDEFVRRRGSHILVSPLDWSLIETWRERGIPLEVVLRGINAAFDVFDRLPRRGRKVNSLFYCQQEVEAEFLAYTQSRVGENRQTNSKPADGIGLEIAAVTDYLRERKQDLEDLARKRGEDKALAEIFTRAARRLGGAVDELKQTGSFDPERLEAELTQIEEMILDGLRRSLSVEESARLRREGEAKLKSYKQGMEAETYQKTLENYLARMLREQFKVPRLSLFYL